MANGSIICPDQFEEWEEEYEDWKDCKKDLSEVKEDYWKAVAALELACPGALAAGLTGIGAVLGGAACALALWNMYDAADDLSDKVDDCNEKAEDSDEEGEKYKDCVNEHKRDASS